ncbi:MAG: NAD(P)H-dependent oxidoreductase [Clostridia bacterium]|nr:NAD(P)H-dependent oxidoreductase [Clostridia bacterium]
MKKTISLVLSMLMLLSLALTGCAAETQTTANSKEIILQIGNPQMTINGAEKPIDDNDTAPVIVNERTLLPVRAVVEEMGGSVLWNGETKEVTLNYGADEIKLTIDSKTAYLNGEGRELDTAPQIINDRTMLPIRFIAESFTFDVLWDGETQKITITKPETQAETEPETEPAIEPETEAQSKTLVVYFSATGTTKGLAEKVAKVAGADIVELVPSQPYTEADINYNSDCRANREQNDDTARPEIANVIENFDSYDTVIIGHPIWWGTVPRIIYTFMDSYDLSGKDVYMFCTSGSSGISTAVSDVKKYAPDANIIDGMRGTSSTDESQIKSWLEGNGYKK